MIKKSLYIFCSAALLSCASGPLRKGHVVMKISPTEAHVAMGSNEVKVGDHIELYHNECSEVGEHTSKRECKKIDAGHGVVTAVLNADYSIVKFADGTKFSEGDTIEKHRH